MSRDLAPCDWVEVHGVRVTTPLRTALDVGCSLSRRSALAAMDELMRGHGFNVQDLRRQLPRCFRRRGVIQLRELVPLVNPQAESQPESWTRLEMIDHGLPQPEVQRWVYIDGKPTYRARDAVRRRWLRENGWTVIVVDKSSFAGGAVEVWVDEIRVGLAEAAKRRRRSYASRY